MKQRYLIAVGAAKKEYRYTTSSLIMRIHVCIVYSADSTYRLSLNMHRGDKYDASTLNYSLWLVVLINTFSGW